MDSKQLDGIACTNQLAHPSLICDRWSIDGIRVGTATKALGARSLGLLDEMDSLVLLDLGLRYVLHAALRERQVGGPGTRLLLDHRDYAVL